MIKKCFICKKDFNSNRNVICCSIECSTKRFKIYQKYYYLAYKKDIQEYKKNYNKTHKKEIQLQTRLYRKTHKKKIQKLHKEYYKKNKINILIYQKQYRKMYYPKNKKQISKRMKKYRLLNRKKILEYNKKYYRKNKSKILRYNRKYTKNRMKKDINFKLRKYLRSRIWKAIKNNFNTLSTVNLIGWSLNHLRKHFEKQFTSGMSWSNYGKWHIDHIKPCASFDLSKPSEQKKCFNYTNLQPLWARENWRKNDKIL